MRKELAKMEGARMRFTAIIARLGKKNNFKGAPSETVLFTDVRNEQGELMTQHVWFTVGKQLSCVYDNVGKRVSFDARVSGYVKGFKGYGLEILKPKEADFKLSNPTNVAVIHNSTNS
jgi:hypothetical protein